MTDERVDSAVQVTIGRAMHPRRGPHNPVSTTPERRANSVRRTTTHDSIRVPDPLGPLHMIACGRDLVTRADLATDVVSEAEVDVMIDYIPNRLVSQIVSSPPLAGIETLVGVSASSGFRRAVTDIAPDLRQQHALRFQLLDDVPTAALVSGYAVAASGVEMPPPPPGSMKRNEDLCAGWAAGATIMIDVDKGLRPPLVTGPVVASMANAHDTLAWHDFGALPPHSMRRARRIDAWRDGDVTRIDSFFRDSYFDVDGIETVIHEYTIAAKVDVASMTFTSCAASIGALPWMECPSAAASAERLVGAPVVGLRDWVRETFVGTTTCTHLNDTLRALEDVDVLIGALAS